MIKMIIRMDDEKIASEGKYSLDGIYYAIDSAFLQMQLPQLKESADYRVYCDNNHALGYGRFGRIVNTFKRQPWFMENVSEWKLCDDEDMDNADAYNEEDLLEHYRKKAMVHRSGK